MLLGAAAVPLCQSAIATAQDQVAPPALEDLIPDSAVDNPDDWANDGTPADVAEAVEDATAEAIGLAEPELEPDSPLAELPDMMVGWPDGEDLPQLAPLAPDEDIQFAAIDEEILPALPDAQVQRLNGSLVLAFPADADGFPERTAFVDRFEALSTIEEFDTDDDNTAQLAARARRDEELLGTLLRIYGYYDAQVTRTVGGILSAAPPVESTSDDKEAEVRFDILPGARYRFGAIDLGNLDEAPDAALLRSTFEIALGDFLSSDKIVEEQFDLDTALGETGYAFAQISEPELLIDHARIEGDLTLPVRPNGKYVFGEVISSLPEFLSSRHLGDIARFEPGDIYQRSLELDMRRAVTATGLVSAVTVTPREVVAPVGDTPGVVAMDIGLEKAPLRTIAGAIGYGSEEGIRVQASWEHRNFFPPEGLVRVRGVAGTQEQLVGLTFRKNNFYGRDRILSVDAFASTIDSKAFEARTVSLIGTYERVSTLLFQKPLSWSIGAELVATQERPPTVGDVRLPRETFFVVALPASGLIDTTDDLLDPTKGFRLGGRFSPEVSRNRGVQSFYLRGQVEGSYYRTVRDGIVVAGRALAASIPGTDLRNIAPSRRIYAGGGGSVRGYGFREIGPRDTLGDPSGGRSKVELSLEARIRTGLFDGAVSVVPFVDAGSVSPGVTPGFEDIQIGAGLGVRYYTGFGPIRVDVAAPLNPRPDDSPVAVYVSLGQAF